jgi:hypothetical protein
MRRLLLLVIPQTIILVIAVLYERGILTDPKSIRSDQALSIFISVFPFVLKFYTLFADLKDAFLLVFVYPFLRCSIFLTTKQNLSLQEYINLRIEIILNQMLKSPEYALKLAVSFQNHQSAGAPISMQSPSAAVAGSAIIDLPPRYSTL